jgi:hypothetical protein
LLIPARQVLWLCLLVFSSHSVMAAGNGPNRHLKGINIIGYNLTVEKTLGGDQCKIDQDNLNTSIEFVANQSTKLKIVPFSEHRSSELLEQSNVTSLSNADKEPAKKLWHDYNFMPRFFIGIMPLQTTQFTCAGSVNAQLLAYAENTNMIPTQAPLYYPMVEIWSNWLGFVGPQQTFSNQTINLTEQIMKQLVNDWAAAQ